MGMPEAGSVAATTLPIGKGARGPNTRVEAGTNDFLTKPINKTELLLRVRSALQSRLYKKQLDQALAYIEGVEQVKP